MTFRPRSRRLSLRFLACAACLALGLAFGGCQSSKKRDYAPTVARFFLEARETEAGMPLQLPRSGVTLTVLRKPVITELDIVDAEVVQVDLGRCLLFQLTPAAGRDLYRLTGSSQGRRLVLALNDGFVGARRIDGPFADGAVLVFAEVDDDQLVGIAQSVKRTSADLQKELARQ